MNNRTKQAEQDAPLLLSGQQAAAMRGKSIRTWCNWDSAGLVPRPIRIRRCTLWRWDELRQWIEADCPSRQEWEQTYRKDRHRSA